MVVVLWSLQLLVYMLKVSKNLCFFGVHCWQVKGHKSSEAKFLEGVNGVNGMREAQAFFVG